MKSIRLIFSLVLHVVVAQGQNSYLEIIEKSKGENSYVLAKALNAVGRTSDSYTVLRSLYAADSSNLDIVYDLGRVASSLGYFNDACEWYSILVEADSSNLMLKGRLAESLFRIEDYDLSIKLCESIIEQDSTIAGAYTTLGNCYLALGNKQEASIAYYNATNWSLAMLNLRCVILR